MEPAADDFVGSVCAKGLTTKHRLSAIDFDANDLALSRQGPGQHPQQQDTQTFQHRAS